MDKNSAKAYERMQISTKIRELLQKGSLLSSNQIEIILRCKIKQKLTRAEKVLIFSLHELVKLKEQQECIK